MGKKASEAAKILVDTLQIPMTAEEYLREREIKQNEMFPDCSVMPGALKLVSHLKRKGIPIAVATSSFQKAYDLKTKNHNNLFSQFDVVILGN